MPQLESPADVQYQHQLPTVSFRVITDDPSLSAPAGVNSDQMQHYGFNNFSDFNQPEHYIRYIEPIESELAVQVEYDMDEQDLAWIDAINAERKKDQAGPISYEVFEVIMDKLEKEWFNLIKRIPQPASHMPVEDSKCAVCDDGEGENSNAIVFCDGCNLAVHQDCYGVPYIPEGQWLCRKCTVSPENPVSCLVCPNEGGAFKQTTSGHWAHLLCAIWIPELTLGNAIYMEPIDGVEAIPKNRWKLICSLCREKMGACIQCENRNCFTAFHVTCARQMGYLMAMKSVHNDGSLKAFCDKHLPDELRKDTFDDEFDSEFAGTPLPKHRRESRTAVAAVTTKTARAHAKSYRPGPPIVPQLIVQALYDYTSKLAIRKKAGFMEKLCRYWSLKREARRGAPLLKRLHLEPWTASNAGRQQTEAEKELKLSFLRMLRNDLEKVRMLAEQVRKREQQKLRQAQVIKEVVDGFLFPGYEKLRSTLEEISKMDRQELFLNPVNRYEVPDYFQVIKEPMSWLQMDDKLEKNMYRDIASFKRDVELVLDNAMLYNQAENVFHKTAKRIKANVQPLLEQLDSIAAQTTAIPPDEDIDISSIPEGAIGDLEPSLLLLRSLLHTSEVTPETDNLASLFLFEMTRPRPPTPSPPPPPPRKEKAKEKAKMTNEEKWAARDAAAKERLGARATRSAINANSAFAQEVGLVPSDTEAHSRQNSGDSPAMSRRSGKSRLAPPLNAEASSSAQTADVVQSDAEAHSRQTSGEGPARRSRRSNVAPPTPAAEPSSSVGTPAERSSGSRRVKLVPPTAPTEEVSALTDTPAAEPSRSRRSKAVPPPAAAAAAEASSAANTHAETSSGSRRSKAAPVPAPAAEGSSSVGTPGEGSTSSRPRHRQVGVAAIETFAIISDKERKQREMALDLFTEEVDEADAFKRFNRGWVLPPGTKRRRPDSFGSTLGVPRARTQTTSPLVQPAALPAAPTPPPEPLPQRAPPPPSSPLSAASSDSLTPPDSEDVEPNTSAQAATTSAPLDEDVAGEAEPSAKPTASASKSKKRRRTTTSSRQRKRRRVGKESQVEDGGMEVDEEERAVEAEVAAVDEEEAIQVDEEPAVPPAEEAAVSADKDAEVGSEDDLTPVPESEGEAAEPAPVREPSVRPEPVAQSTEDARAAEPKAPSSPIDWAANSRRRSGRISGTGPSPPPGPAPAELSYTIKKRSGRKSDPAPRPPAEVDAPATAEAPVAAEAEPATADVPAPTAPPPGSTPRKRTRSARMSEPAPAPPADAEVPVLEPAVAVVEAPAPAPAALPVEATTRTRTRSGRMSEAAPAPPAEAEQPGPEPAQADAPVPATFPAEPTTRTRTRSARTSEVVPPATTEPDAEPESAVAEASAHEPRSHARERSGRRSAAVLPDSEAPTGVATAQSVPPSGRKSGAVPVVELEAETAGASSAQQTPRKRERSGRKSEAAGLADAAGPSVDGQTPRKRERSGRNVGANAPAAAGPEADAVVPPPAEPTPRKRQASGRKSLAAPAEAGVNAEAGPSVESTPCKRQRSGRKSEAVTAPLAEPEPEPEPEAEPEVNAEASAPKRSHSKKKGKGRKSKASMELVVEVTAEPEPEAESEPEDLVIAEPDEESLEDDAFPVGTLVWAKIPFFPYFPAEIVDPYDDEVDIPSGVLDLQPDVDAEDAERNWLVRFFDATRSYAWVVEAKLDMLGDSEEIDETYLAGNEKDRKKGFKSKGEKARCQKAYELAKASMLSSAEE